MPTLDDFIARYGDQPPAPAAPQAAPQESLVRRGLRRTVQETLATPAIVGTIYGLIGSAYDYYTSDDPDVTWGETLLSPEGMATAKAASEGDVLADLRIAANPSAMLRTGLQSATEWYDWGGDIAGVTDNPDGTVPLGEEALGIAGSALTPLPTKLFSLPTKLATGVTNKAARAAITGLTKGVELSLPGTVSEMTAKSFAKNAAANIAVQEATNDVVRTLTEQPTLYGAVLGTNPAEAATIVAQTGEGLPVTDAQQPDEEGDALRTGALGALAGGAAIALGGPAAVRALTRRTLTDTVTSTGTTDLGELPVREGAAVVDNLADIGERVLHKEGILKRAVEATRGKAAAETFEDKMRTQAGNATHVAFQRYLDTGILEGNGSVKTVAPRGVFQQYAQMPTAERGLFDKTVQALNERVRRDLGEPPNLGLSDSDLHDIVTRGLNNPRVAKLVADHDDIYRGFSQLRFNAGITDLATHAKETALRFDPRTGYGGYAPNIPKAAPVHWLTRARKAVIGGGRDTTVQSARARTAAGGVTDMLPPMEALSSYMQRQMSKVNSMRIRREFLEAVADQPVRDFSAGRRVATTQSNLGGESTVVYKDGKRVEYWIGDPRIKRALEFEPYMTMPVANVMRKAFQAGTTGNFNPMFAPVSLAYDAMFGMLSANTKHQVTGLLDQALARRGFSPTMRNMFAGLTRPIDTALLIGEAVLIEGRKGRLAEETARHLAMRAAQTGLAVDKAAADAAAQVFISTKYGMMHMRGYSANSLTEDLTRLNDGQAQKALDKFIDVVTGQFHSRAGRGYVHFLDNIRDAYRMGMFTRNVAHQQWLNQQAGRSARLTPEQYRRITRHVRDVAVDPARRGANDWVNRMTSATPYGNIMIQSAAHLAKVMATNPGAWAVAGSVTAMTLLTRSLMSPEARAWVDERMPGYKRYSSLTFELPHGDEPFDPARHLYSFPLGAEMGLTTHGPVALIEGMIRERESFEPGFGAQMMLALGDLLSLPTPPAVNVVAGIAGYGQLDVGSALRGDSLFRQPQDPGGIAEHRGIGHADGLMTDWLYNTMAAAFGSFGRTVADSVEIMDQEAATADPQMWQAFNAAMGNVYFDRIAKPPVGTLFSGVVTEQPRGTPMQRQAYEVNQALKRIAAFARQTVPTITEGPRDADIPYDVALTRLPESLSDPVLAQEAMIVRAYFLSAPHERAMQNIDQLRRSYFQTRNVTRGSLNTRNTVLNAINEEMHANYRVVLDQYGKFEEGMRQRTGNRDWSLTTFTDAVERDIQSGNVPGPTMQ